MLFQVGGEVTEDDAQALIHKLETDLAVLPSPVLQIVGVGALVRSGGDNVYAQLGGDTEMLYRLKNDIGRSIDELGLALDLKPFAPNITILHGCRFGNPKLRVRSNSFFLSHLALYMSQPTVFQEPIPRLRAHLGNSLYEVKKRNGCIRSFFGWFAHRLYMPRVVVK